MKGLSFQASIRETKKVNSRAGPEGWGRGGSVIKNVHFERMRIWVQIPSTYIKIQPQMCGLVTSALGRSRELTG